MAATGFCERSDAKDRVALHRRRIADRQGAKSLHMNVVVMADESNQSRHLFTFDVSRQHLVHSPKPRF
jgi:hypothetical protein